MPAEWRRAGVGLYVLGAGDQPARKVSRVRHLRGWRWQYEALYQGRWLVIDEYRTAKAAMADGR